MIRFRGIIQTAFVSPSPKRKQAKGISRNFTICASPFIPLVDPMIVHSPSLQVLPSNLSLADVPQRSEEWFALRKDKLTTGAFGTALGLWKGSRRPELWQEKVFASEAQIMEANNAMAWGTLKEAVAVEQYKKITGDEVSSMGFAVHLKQSCYWLGASPDGVLGILEVNCPYNKGKPEAGLPWLRMPFYYMPQVQGQMEIMDCE
ncbi:hypothetical protein AAZX31_05G134100 [Glycine max]